MKYQFVRAFLVLLVVSMMFQVMLNWDDLLRADWEFRVLLRMFPAAVAVALIAAGAVAMFKKPDQQDDD
jgi:hypothetical protein